MTSISSVVRIVKVDPAAKGSFAAAFVLPITREHNAVLTKEKRGKVVKYGMLGGKARPDETDFQCMSREANEESAGAFSQTTLARIAEGRGILGGDGAKVFYERAKCYAVKHDLVVPSDQDVTTRFDRGKAKEMRTSSSRATICKKAKKAKKETAEQLGIELVPMAKLCDLQWRQENMHHVPFVLASRLLKL